jgi:aminoglycoside phosphotransferase (APT) family kinase protein
MELEQAAGPEGGATLDRGAAAQTRAEALWVEIAAELGLPVTDARFRRLQVNSRRQDWRSVLQISLPDGARFVLRADFDQRPAPAFSEVLNRHRAAATGLRARPGVSAPAILWQHPDQPIYLMEFSAGDTAFRSLAASSYGIGDRAALLQRIGEAVAALHQASGVGQRQFWPKPFFSRISEHAQALREGQIALPRPNRFLGLCALLHRLGRAARGCAFEAAVEHGDLHLRNILISESEVSFIDFANHKGIFPQRDLATLWLANCPDHLAQEGQAPGYGLVAEADWSAFQRGYGAELVTDPVFRFFFALRLFNAWLQLAQKPQPLDAKSTEQAEAYVRVFKSLLAEE